jgi:hypothetical protein
VSANTIESILNKIATFGLMSVKRIDGDWSSPQLIPWHEKIQSNALTAVQQFAHVKGKNATDIAMIIDAMDWLHSKVLDGFCIISSDSDFTSLAVRIRAAGLLVYGFGDLKTPKIFRNSCDQFVCIKELMLSAKENLAPITAKQQPKIEEKPVIHTESTNKIILDQELITLIASIIKSQKNKEGWCSLGLVKTHMINIKPNFKHNDYGYNKFSTFITSIDLFEIKEGNSNLVRMRPQPTNHNKLLLSNTSSAKTKDNVQEKSNRLKSVAELNALILTVLKEIKNQNGWYNVGQLSQGITKMKPDFKPKNYGYSKFSSLIKSTDLFVFNKCNDQIKLKYNK